MNRLWLALFAVLVATGLTACNRQQKALAAKQVMEQTLQGAELVILNDNLVQDRYIWNNQPVTRWELVEQCGQLIAAAKQEHNRNLAYKVQDGEGNILHGGEIGFGPLQPDVPGHVVMVSNLMNRADTVYWHAYNQEGCLSLNGHQVRKQPNQTWSEAVAAAVKALRPTISPEMQEMVELWGQAIAQTLSAKP